MPIIGEEKPPEKDAKFLKGSRNIVSKRSQGFKDIEAFQKVNRLAILPKRDIKHAFMQIMVDAEEESKEAEGGLLIPHEELYPFDGIAKQIIMELQKRNWDIPGIDIGFDSYGHEGKYKLVEKVDWSEGDVRLHFGRVQGILPDGVHNDTGGLSIIQIPEKQVEVYGDLGGPDLYTYVGQDWEKDRDLFRDDVKVNAKSEGKPKIYLRYSGRPVYGQGQKNVSTDLYAANKPHTEYSPEGEERVQFKTSDVFNEVHDHMKKLLEHIQRHPV